MAENQMPALKLTLRWNCFKAMLQSCTKFWINFHISVHLEQKVYYKVIQRFYSITYKLF